MSKFAAMKFRVTAPGQCAAIQEALFALGYKWQVEPHKETRNLGARSIYAEPCGTLLYDEGCLDTFRGCEYPEQTLEDIQAVPVAEVVKPPPGLRPAWRVAEDRVNEIMEAMYRTEKIPLAWVVELGERLVEERAGRENSHG